MEVHNYDDDIAYSYLLKVRYKIQPCYLLIYLSAATYLENDKLAFDIHANYQFKVFPVLH